MYDNASFSSLFVNEEISCLLHVFNFGLLTSEGIRNKKGDLNKNSMLTDNKFYLTDQTSFYII